MREQRIRWHIVQGDPTAGHDFNRMRGERVDWTVPMKANPGDGVVFYMIGPERQFVASGSVATKPTKKRSSWPTRRFADIDHVTPLVREVSLYTMRRHLPRWRYLDSVQAHVTVPQALEAPFLRVLGIKAGPVPRLAPLAEIEGVRREVKHYVRSRSLPIRDEALRRANGVCDACEQDYGSWLDGDGRRVLQVHHKKQLSLREVPELTLVRDVAVLCANCHLLVHADPKRAMSVHLLRKRLRGNRPRTKARR
jgi:hypothetical protein